MRPLWTMLAGLLTLGVLTYLCANHHRAAIGADLGGKARQSLAVIGLGDAKASAEGQIITLNGQVPDEATRQKAGAAAAAIFGVSEVRNLLTVAAAPVMTREERAAAINCQEQFADLLKTPIVYRTGSAVISPGSYPLLDRLAEAAKLCPAARIEVGGHTDPRGGLETNMKLSQRRADSVVAYLAGKGLDAQRFTAVGYGPNKPVADNSTADGMQKNRRTEFVVKGI